MSPTKNLLLQKSCRVVAVLLMVLVVSGCSVQPLKPWQRGYLARGDMQGAPDPLEAAFKEHIYFSKEASTGGASSGGGGCGCN